MATKEITPQPPGVQLEPPVIGPGHNFASVTEKIARIVLTKHTPLGWIFGFLIAYAIFPARRGLVLTRVAVTASGVFANFGGVPLAFLFIATLGTTGVAT